MHWLVPASTPDTAFLTLRSVTFVSIARRSAVPWSCFRSLSVSSSLLLDDRRPDRLIVILVGYRLLSIAVQLTQVALSPNTRAHSLQQTPARWTCSSLIRPLADLTPAISFHL